MVISLAEKKRRLKDRKPARSARAEDGEKLDARVVLYLRRSEKVDLELLAEAQGETLCGLIRDLLERGQKNFEIEG